MIDVLMVGMGGFAGCALRYLLARATDILMPNFPVGTLTVNAIASFLAGAALAATSYGMLDDRIKLIASVGFCGGLSTFSAFSVETLTMLQNREYLSTSFNAVLNISVSLTCAALGYWLASLCIAYIAE